MINSIISAFVYAFFFPNNIKGNCKQVVLKISVVLTMKYKFLITCSIIMK